MLTFVFGTAFAIGFNKVEHDTHSAEAASPFNTMRIWISSDSENPIHNSGGKPGLWFHTGPNNNGDDVYVTSHSDGAYGEWNNNAEGGRKYYYFDVPTRCVGSYMTIQRFSSDWQWWNQSNSTNFYEGQAKTHEVFYLWGDQTTISRGSIGIVDAGLATKALEGLLTCSSSVYNGYGAFPKVCSTFIKNGDSWKTVGNLNDCTFNDFVNVDDYNSSRDIAPLTMVNGYEKFLALETAYNANPQYSKSNMFPIVNSNTTAIIVAISISAIICVSGAFLFFKKRSIR